MAEDNSARNRPADFGRGPTPANDPLAELARLIGKNDPYGDYRPAQPAPPAYSAPVVQPPQADPVPQSDPAPSYASLPPPQFGDDPAPSFLTRPAPQFDREPLPQAYAPPSPQPYTPQPYAPQPYAPYVPPQPSYAQEPPQQPYVPAAPQSYAPQSYAPQSYAPQSYAPEPPQRSFAPQPGPRYASDFPSHNDWPGSPAPQPQPSYASHDPFAAPPAAPYDSPNRGHVPGMPSFGGQPFADPQGRPERQGLPPHPGAGGMPSPQHEDEFYDDDDEPRGDRRRGMLTVVAVLGLAVVGTAGAFGYRSMFGGPGTAAPPPVIRASGEPSKVAPPPVTADASSASKFSYDRFGDAGKDEQVVKREEKPVDLSKVAPAPRTVFPGAPTPSNAQSSKAQASGANPPSAIGEPRRVRTVPIRPEQGGDAASAPPAQQPNTVAADPVPRAQSRVAMRQPAPVAQQQAPAGNAPLSLSPDANNAAAPQPFVQEAAPAPAPRAPTRAAPTRIATAPVQSAAPAAPAASGGGSFLVQVSSQKSEADAESAYRGIQSKYGNVLNGQPHQVRRADLGAKGVYYRAMVGPFGSRDAAVQLCSSLKQAGGDCVVQH